MESSDTRYARSGDVHIANRVFGEGPFDLVFAAGLDFPSVDASVRHLPTRSRASGRERRVSR